MGAHLSMEHHIPLRVMSEFGWRQRRVRTVRRPCSGSPWRRAAHITLLLGVDVTASLPPLSLEGAARDGLGSRRLSCCIGHHPVPPLVILERAPQQQPQAELQVSPKRQWCNHSRPAAIFCAMLACCKSYAHACAHTHARTYWAYTYDKL